MEENKSQLSAGSYFGWGGEWPDGNKDNFNIKYKIHKTYKKNKQ